MKFKIPIHGGGIMAVLASPAVAVAQQVADTAFKPPIEKPAFAVGRGPVANFGQGRIGVFGEAAMFSAQLAGPQKSPLGMNSPLAKQNPQFLLNLIHWLTGIID